MALDPKISVCLQNDCTELVPTDVTGTYDANDNPGGWGSPNISGSDVDTAELIVTRPDGSENTYDLTSEVPNSFSGDYEYNPITDSPWNDGKYCIVYHIKAEEPETRATVVFDYNGGNSATDNTKYTVEVDTTGDGSVDTTIGSYTTGTNEDLDKVYSELETDINNNSNFDATDNYNNSDKFQVTAPSGTGSSYNGNPLEVQEAGSKIDGGSFDGGVDAIDVDERYKICEYFTCHTRCCVEKMLAKVPDHFCKCGYDSFVEDAMLAEGLLRGVNASTACDCPDKSDDILKRIQKLCNFNDCGC